jgi:hypothetical protein
MKSRNIYFLLIVFLLAACKPEIEEFTPGTGNADFSSYLAIGNSLTAGYADGSLYLSGQENSYPNLLAEQFMEVGGGEFKQPLMLDDYGIGFDGIIPVPKFVLGFPEDCFGATSLAPVRADVQVDLQNLNSVAGQGPFNNMGVPGMQSTHLQVPGYAALNPYFGRMVSAPTNSIMDEIMRVDATFFTVWIGNNDVLGYASSGGEGAVITPPGTYAQIMGGLLEYLLSQNMKGVVANVPDVLGAPFFTTVPYNALVLPDQATADQLNSAYAPLNQQIVGSGFTDTIHFRPGPNPMVIEDASLPWGLRHILEEELLLLTLPQDSIKCGGWGSQVAVPSQFVLDTAEIQNVHEAITSYNEELLKLVVNQPVAYLDINSILAELNENGITVDGVTLSSELVTGNAFSLDGLHLTPIGSAYVANQFIGKINERFSANIPLLNVAQYPSVVFP